MRSEQALVLESISLSTQELADDFRYWAQDGVKINLCSLNQIQRFGSWKIGEPVGLRFNLALVPVEPIRTNVGVHRAVLASGKMIWKKARDLAKSLV